MLVDYYLDYCCWPYDYDAANPDHAHLNVAAADDDDNDSNDDHAAVVVDDDDYDDDDYYDYYDANVADEACYDWVADHVDVGF